jgi:hypothetical protein
MTKKELLDAFKHNAFGCMQQGEEKNDEDLQILAHANLIALAAIQNGHQQFLMMAFAAFVESVKEFEEEKQNDAFAELIKGTGISLS